jgi:hypothetical protein
MLPIAKEQRIYHAIKKVKKEDWKKLKGSGNSSFLDNCYGACTFSIPCRKSP